MPRVAPRLRRLEPIYSAAALVALCCACQRTEHVPNAHATAVGRVQSTPANGTTFDDSESAGANWPMVAGSYANTRFSTLSEIDTNNAARLEQVWTFDTGLRRGHEAAPLVIDGTMYLVSPFPNRVFALDVRQRTPVQKWKFEPKVDLAAEGVACCDVVNRGMAFDKGRLFFNTLDAHTIALDAETGAVLWDTVLGDIHKGETMTMAPIVVKDRVLVGNSGGELGVRGWLTALNAADGSIAWRAYSTGPDKDVLIGPEFHPFYPQDRGQDLGISTWPSEKWKIGGGTVWGFLSYDPALDLVYYGTANPGPWNARQRPGDNKWTAGIFARRPEDGAAVWFYQYSPHDLYDYDGVNEAVLIDARTPHGVQKLIVHPDRNGFLYVIDRTTGRVISADSFVRVTTATKIDLQTGRPVMVKEKEPKIGSVTHDICPAAPGGKDWQPSAFSPKTGLLYIPHNNLCQDEEGMEANYIAGTPYVGAAVRMTAATPGQRGWFTAWDPLRKTSVWRIPERFPAWSGALATAGNLVFYGTMDGWFKALDATSGRVLWQKRLSSGVIGQPITYRGGDGHQYVAVFSGVGGWSGAVVSAGLDTTDPTAGNGFGNAMRELPSQTQKGGTLYAFALP